GQNVKEVLDCDLAAEISARTLYEEAATHCHSVRDYVSRDLFEKLMHDEEEHIDFLETQLDLVAKLGLELYAQHHIGELEEDGDYSPRRRFARCGRGEAVALVAHGDAFAGDAGLAVRPFRHCRAKTRQSMRMSSCTVFSTEHLRAAAQHGPPARCPKDAVLRTAMSGGDDF